MNRVFINVTGSGARQTLADPPGGTTAVAAVVLSVCSSSSTTEPPCPSHATTYTTRSDGGSNDFHVHYSLDDDPSFVFMIHVAYIYARIRKTVYVREHTHTHTHIINVILCVRLIPIRSAVNNNCGKRDDRGSDSAVHVTPRIPKRRRLYPRPRHDAKA